MRLVGTVLFLFLFISVNLAQRKLVKVEEPRSSLVYPKYRLGFSPSAFASLNPAFQISNDFGITPFLNLTLETGFIFASYDWWDFGFKTRTGLEYKVSHDKDRFYAIGVNYVYEDLEENRVGDDVKDQFGYIEEVEYRKHKTTKGIVISVTTAQRLSEKLRLELGIGYGKGDYIVSNAGEFRDPDDFDFEPLTEFDRPGEYKRAIVYFNINFSYVLVE